MINHARTLLMNVSGRTSQRQEPGEEYIPASYRPVELPSYLQTARKLLLGVSPDRYFLNYRVRELMHYLHQTELSDYVYALDPRVTYWPEINAPFFGAATKINAPQVAGPTGAQLFFSGRLVANNAIGRCAQNYNVSLYNAPALTLKIAQGTKETNTELTVTNNLSQAVPLGDCGLSVRIGKPEAAVHWTVTTLARPKQAITTVLPALEIIGEPVVLELFGVLTTTQPYATFLNLWREHPNPVYRLGGFVLAMIYRTEEVRRGNNG